MEVPDFMAQLAQNQKISEYSCRSVSRSKAPWRSLFVAVFGFGRRFAQKDLLFPQMEWGQILESAKDERSGNRGSFRGPDSDQSFRKGSSETNNKIALSLKTRKLSFSKHDSDGSPVQIAYDLRRTHVNSNI